MTNKDGISVEGELLACPFCGGPAEIRLHRYSGTGASGMETPKPYAACVKGCVAMKPERADDWPHGRKAGWPTSEQDEEAAIVKWNTRAYLALSERNLDLEAVNHSLRDVVRDASEQIGVVRKQRDALSEREAAKDAEIARLQEAITSALAHRYGDWTDILSAALTKGQVDAG